MWILWTYECVFSSPELILPCPRFCCKCLLVKVHRSSCVLLVSHYHHGLCGYYWNMSQLFKSFGTRPGCSWLKRTGGALCTLLTDHISLSLSLSLGLCFFFSLSCQRHHCPVLAAVLTDECVFCRWLRAVAEDATGSFCLCHLQR